MNTFQEAVDFLYQIRLFGTKLGLETMLALCRELGNPQRSLRFVHLAGTNGKGSVGAMLERCLRRAGYRVGFYTSPHLVSFRERIRLGGRAIPEADVLRIVRTMEPILDRVATQPDLRYPTFFEVVTALALSYFAESRTDIVVWETGMGGRLDATNVVDPELAVITNVQRDHQKYLGESPAAIAREKAGIIKQGVTVVTGAEGETYDIVAETASAHDADLIGVGGKNAARVVKIGWDGIDLEIPGDGPWSGPVHCGLAGRHQVVNTALAVASLEQLSRQAWRVSPTHVRESFGGVRWPGRLQLLDRDPLILLDGAHNAPAAAVLKAAVRELAPEKDLILLLGILQDKDHAEMCRILAPIARSIVVTRVRSHRTTEQSELAEECRRAAPGVPIEVVETAEEGLETARRGSAGFADPLVCVAGSLFLVGEVCSLLGVDTIDLC